ncbi:4'-phosphopantetheinyl transferase superfamily protein [Streptomyces sp. NPDC051132]|uniref:4'-phosphopantetheinyl transferase family protein n=1 Tax=unclassified Streptomyces TaxID=2593676 RepID=UPI00342A79B7
MIDEVLPEAAVSAESFGDPPDAWLFAAERAALGEVGEARRREYTTVRHCARRAIDGLGLPPAPLLPGPRGAPQWPDGVVGSMTHCAGYRAAAVARHCEVRTVGIDAEPHAPLPEGVLDYIALPEESAAIARLVRQSPDVHWDRLLFSAKEALYKAWFPLTHRWLGFDQAVIIPEPDGTFHARVLLPALPEGAGITAVFGGRWLARNGLLLACASCPAAFDRVSGM